ncbi:RNA recognition motif domain [Trypanosoma melophagium]|uniref:RNA recognition motif domain n=1 Tax=Trypanosoma melophagium TaxID=715481 RepID=UPI003519DA6F|nr:RNA recognition motif domain [Trypanosoma melophagium]
MSTTNFVKLYGISTDATARDVEEFMMYCGTVRSVVISADPMSETGQSAIVEFEDSNGVELAQLLSGAVFHHHEVHIRPFNDKKKNIELKIETGRERVPTAVTDPNISENHRPLSLLRSAMEAVEKLQERKILSKGSGLLNRLRQEAKQVSYGISSATVQVIDRVGSTTVGVGTKPTMEQWDYMSTQPQWGKRMEWGGN